jgi:hypothetical protein
MSDPVGDRLRSYYQSVQTNAPAGLPSRVDRALDSTPTARTVRVPWQPAGLLAAIAAIVVLALVVRNLEPASLPLPSGSAGPSTSPWSLTNLGVSAGLETGEPGETPSAVETPSADPSATPTATPTARRTLSPTLSPAPTAMPTATPFRGSGNLVRVGAMTPNLSGPAVRLRDGPVLIAGGMTVRADAIRVKTNLAELYEPGSHSFVSTGPMADARYDHTATLLADGRVLVAGGADLMDGIDNLATADIYDPLVGTFTRTGSMAQGRAGHSATLRPRRPGTDRRRLRRRNDRPADGRDIRPGHRQVHADGLHDDRPPESNGDETPQRGCPDRGRPGRG